MTSDKRRISPRQIYARLASARRARKEHLFVFCLDAKGRAVQRELVSVGILNAALAHPREVFFPAIVHNAASIILAHNHPSGDTSPSEDDMATTQRMVRAGAILGIEVTDHIIVGQQGYTSLREAGLIT